MRTAHVVLVYQERTIGCIMHDLKTWAKPELKRLEVAATLGGLGAIPSEQFLSSIPENREAGFDSPSDFPSNFFS